MDFNAKLDLLKEIQTFLETRFKLENDMENIPKSNMNEREMLNRLEAKYLSVDSSIKSLNKDLNRLKASVADIVEFRKEREHVVETITSQREFEAIQKEIDDAIVSEQKLSDALREKQKRLDEEKSNLDECLENISYQKEKVKEEDDKNIIKIKKIEEELLKCKSEINKKTPLLEDTELLFKFERIVKNKHKGVVPIVESTCSGCNIMLPMEFINEVHLSSNFNYCPYCGRILYYDADISVPKTNYIAAIEDEEVMDIFDDEADFYEDDNSFKEWLSSEDD